MTTSTLREHVLATAVATLASIVLGLPGLVFAQQARSGVSSVTLLDGRREAMTVHGTVRAVRADGSRFVISVDAAAPNSFAVIAERRADVPISVGDVIAARVDCSYPGWHYVCSSVVLDGAGALLVAVAGQGEEAVAPGWRLVGDGPAPPGQGRVDQPLVLEHQATTGGSAVRVTTDPERWVRVRTADGEWRVSGSYSHFVGSGPIPPDSSDYRQYAITRVGATAAATAPSPMAIARAVRAHHTGAEAGELQRALTDAGFQVENSPAMHAGGVLTPRLIVTFAQRIAATRVARALGIQRPCAFSPDVHQTTWIVERCRGADGHRLAASPLTIGDWTIVLNLSERPSGQPRSSPVGPSPAYDLGESEAASVELTTR